MSDIALPPPEGRARKKIGELSRFGLIVSFILVVVIGGWLAIAPLSSAVIASGTLVVETSVKKVQHSSGGIVSEIFVVNGDEVTYNQPLLQLDDTVAEASRDIFQAQVDEMVARQARLNSEVAGFEEIDFGELHERADMPDVEKLVTRETQIFDIRLQSRRSQEEQLREQIGQINQEIEGLNAQALATEKSISLVADELLGVQDLFEKGLVPVTRLNALEREKAGLDGQYGQLLAEIARARGRIIETQLQIVQLGTQYRDNALATLSETQGQLAELRERLTAAQDQFERTTIGAPQTGIVHESIINTVGGVVGSGEVIMQIIPTADDLVIEAQVSPTDIDQIVIGQDVRITIHAGSAGSIPDLDGIISRISADLTVDERSGFGFYTVRANLPENAKVLLGDLDLIPGMAATAFIQTGSRTPLQYLTKPLVDQISRTFRER